MILRQTSVWSPEGSGSNFSENQTFVLGYNFKPKDTVLFCWETDIIDGFLRPHSRNIFFLFPITCFL